MTLRASNVWPVVQRELREGARRPVNHRLRLLSAGVGTLLLWFIISQIEMPPAEAGNLLFGSLHSLLLALILVVVPALAADGIAREKRDGTLGLLFLTPLSAGGIVTGKALAQAMRAFNLWLAVVPALMIPILTGGVTRLDVLYALSLEFSATVICLGAGMLASTFGKERNSAYILAFLLGAFFWSVFMAADTILITFACGGWSFVQQIGWYGLNLENLLTCCGLIDTGSGNGWSILTAVSSRVAHFGKLICAIGPILSLMIFFAIGWFAARRIERSWQDKIPSPRRESLIRRYCTPMFRQRFRRQMQRSLDWNPIAWLQQYSWKARLSKWGICMGFLLVIMVFDTSDPDIREMVYLVLGGILAGMYTFIGVGGFLEEKRSGALELLLITPVSVNKLIFGRVWGLWKQFLPAGLVLAFCVGFLQFDAYMKQGGGFGAFQADLIVVCGFLLLPVLATYFALRVKNLVVAAVLTWIALLLPNIACMTPLDVGNSAVAVVFVYAGFAFVACFLLRHSLSRRIYAF